MKLLHAFVMGLGCFDSIVVEWTNITTQHPYIKSLSDKSCTNFFLKLLISFVIFNLRLWGYFFAKGQKNLWTMLYELNNISDGYSVVLNLCMHFWYESNYFSSDSILGGPASSRPCRQGNDIWKSEATPHAIQGVVS